MMSLKLSLLLVICIAIASVHADGSLGKDWEKTQVVKLAQALKKHQLERGVGANNEADDEDDSLPCSGCKFLLEFIEDVLEPDKTVNETWHSGLRDDVIAICEVALEVGNDWRGDVMCPGFMDHYATHLMHIVKNTSKTPSEMCRDLDFCEPPKPNDFLPMDRHFGPPPPTKHNGIKRVTRRQRSKANDVRIVQLADIHYDNKYTEGAQTDCGLIVCCANHRNDPDNNQGGSAGRWGDYNCNTPKRTFEYYLDVVANMSPKPDYIIYTGDHPPHAMWEETYSKQLNMSKEVVDLFKAKVPNTTVFPNLGNHELYPTNMFYLPRPEVQDTLEKVSEWWSEVVTLDSTQKSNIRQNAHYTVLATTGLRVISFNTNYGYPMNFYNILNTGSSWYLHAQKFVEDSLAAARTAREKVVMVGHHPPGGCSPTWGKWYNQLMVTYSDVVVLQVSGHTHRDHFNLIRDYSRDGLVRGVYNIAPSMTSLPTINPSARIYVLDGTTHSLKQIEQYRFDLQKAIAFNTEPTLELAYKATEYYDMPDLSANSWLDLVNRMLTNETLFRMHYKNHWAASGNDGACDARCQHNYLCGLVHARGDHQIWCEKGYSNDTTTNPSTMVPTAAPTAAPTKSGANSMTSFIFMILAMMALRCYM